MIYILHFFFNSFFSCVKIRLINFNTDELSFLL